MNGVVKKGIRRSMVGQAFSKVYFDYPIHAIYHLLYKKLERIARGIIIIGTALIIVLQLFSMWIGNIYLLSGQTFVNLRDEKNDLERQNMVLREQIARSSSLKTIEGKIYSLGFKKEVKIIWLK